MLVIKQTLCGLLYLICMKKPPKNIYIVIPCFNEDACLNVLYEELCPVMDKLSCPYELIFVDDGSTDHTLETILLLSEQDFHVRWLSFSRNFGHQKALKAGLDYSRGEVVITMDADMQHPSALIFDMLACWADGYDIVDTIRIDSKQSNCFKTVSSRLFYRLMNFLSDVTVIEGCADFRLLDRKVIEALRGCREEYLFLRGMVSWVGFHRIQISYQARMRYAGTTKYSLKKMILFAICGITSFSIRPLRWAILFAAFFALLSITEIIYVLYAVFISGQAVTGGASLAILISVLGAVILLMLGIIGEYLGKMFMQCKNRPEYIVRSGNCSSSFNV